MLELVIPLQMLRTDARAGSALNPVRALALGIAAVTAPAYEARGSGSNRHAITVPVAA